MPDPENGFEKQIPFAPAFRRDCPTKAFWESPTGIIRMPLFAPPVFAVLKPGATNREVLRTSLFLHEIVALRIAQQKPFGNPLRG